MPLWVRHLPGPPLAPWAWKRNSTPGRPDTPGDGTVDDVHFSEYDTRLAAYAAVVDQDQRLLLTWWNGEGHGTPCWSMPGGGVEFEESLVEAVEREVLEETGYVVSVGSPIAAHSFTDPSGGRGGRPYKSVRIVFAATIVGGSLGTLEAGGSTDFAQWVPLGDVEGLVSKADVVDVASAALVAK
jgi:8-oxo-dGTP diphosphatase